MDDANEARVKNDIEIYTANGLGEIVVSVFRAEEVNNPSLSCSTSASAPETCSGMQSLLILNSQISREARRGETCFGRESRHMSFLLLLPIQRNVNIG